MLFVDFPNAPAAANAAPGGPSTFTDPETGVTIEVLREGAEEATVRVVRP